jgi:multidrug efflux pump
MISTVFIKRPILAGVLSAFIVIAGLASLRSLPVAQYPAILPPTVSVSAFYPGATAQTLSDSVAVPLEQQINGVERMLYMNSISSGSGSLSINVTFAVGTDPDLAAINVNNRVQAALPLLPEEVRRQGVTVVKASNDILQLVTMSSPDKRYDSLYISNYTLLNVLDELKRIPGVGNVQMFGAKDYAMRIWLQPDRLAQLGLTTADVAAAIREQNSQFAAGRVGQEPTGTGVDFTFSVTAQGRFSDPAQFGEIVVRTTDTGAVVRLKDVARVELGSRDYDFISKQNGMEAIPIAIFLQSGANALDVGRAVETRMQELATAFPEGLAFDIPYDTTTYIEVSINEVLKTLGEAMLLVFAVVFLFLQNWRATLIPMLAVPVSLIGALSVMYLLGFSINTLTLFGMVLAIGIVVDDAIVVLENVERIMTTEHLSPTDATVKAMKEVTGPVIAIVLVLCAVFLPVAFLGGLVGEMYRQFAVTIAVSVVISGFVALTLTPALCASLLRPEHATVHGLFTRFNDWFARFTGRYTRGVRYLLRHATLALALFAVLLVATAGLFRLVPNSLAPNEDQGYIMVLPILPDAASLSRTNKVVDQIMGYASTVPAVTDSVGFAGLDLLTFALRTNTGALFLVLDDWDKRKGPESSPGAVAGGIFGFGTTIKDAFVLAFEPPPIQGLSTTGGFEGYVQAKADSDPKALAAATQKLLAATAGHPELAGVQTTFSASVPQMRIELDREKAKSLGIPVNEIFDTLQSTFGALYVNDFNKSGRVFRVYLQSEAEFRAHAQDIRDVYVRTSKGALVPLTAVATIREDTGPEIMERFNVFPAAKVLGNPAPGYSSGQALAVMEKIAAEALPTGYVLAWSGTSYQEKIAGDSTTGVFLLAVLMVFLILAAQYERWTLPLAVILAVPFAVFGAVAAVALRGLQNDIYFQIGLVTLIGLAAKNAILIVEFAMMKHAEGMSYADAAVEAARLRFRPIIMTSLAFILGVAPLAISTGAGAASRHSIGTGVIGGMLVATFVATLFIPLFFRWIASWGDRKEPTSDAEKPVVEVPHG